VRSCYDGINALPFLFMFIVETRLAAISLLRDMLSKLHTNRYANGILLVEGKRVAETLMFDYHRERGTDIRVARIFNTFGDRMNKDVCFVCVVMVVVLCFLSLSLSLFLSLSLSRRTYNRTDAWCPTLLYKNCKANR
jgi:hypothetical protein